MFRWRSDEERDEPELGVVRVLVFVDHDVAPPVLPGAARLLVVLEQEHGAHDQVVEVHRVGVVEPLLVERVDVGRRLLEERRDLLGVRLRRQQTLLGARDPRVHGARREPLGVELELLGARLDEPELVGLVIDREARRVAGAAASRRRSRPQAAWNVITHIRAAVRPPTRRSTRSRISRAARFVNVIARISDGRARSDAIRCATRCVRTRVLPDPRPPRPAAGPRCAAPRRAVRG